MVRAMKKTPLVVTLLCLLAAPAAAQPAEGADTGSEAAQPSDMGGSADTAPETTTEPAAEPALAPEPAAPAEEKKELKVSYEGGKGLKVTSADGEHEITIGGFIQARYNVRENDMTNTTDDWQQEFRMARVFLTMKGKVFKKIGWAINYGMSPFDLGVRDNFTDGGGNAPSLYDAFIDFKQIKAANLRVGLQKVPHNKERLGTAKGFTFIERSPMEGTFRGGNRSFGINLHSKDVLGNKMLAYDFGLFSHRGNDAAGYTPFANGGFALNARVEFSPFGSFKNNFRGDLERSADPKLTIGAAAMYANRARRANILDGALNAGAASMVLVNFDVDFRMAGLNVMGAFAWRGHAGHNSLDDGAGGTVDNSGMGFVTQVGFMIPGVPLEIAAGFDGNIMSSSALTGSRFDLGGGVNYYLNKHFAKVQLDAFERFTSSFAPRSFELRLGTQVVF